MKSGRYFRLRKRKSGRHTDHAFVIAGLLVFLCVGDVRGAGNLGKPTPAIGESVHNESSATHAGVSEEQKSRVEGALVPSPTMIEASEQARANEVTTMLREHLPASLSLEYATLLITVVTLIFAIFLAAFGFFEWTRFKKLQKNIETERRALKKTVKAFKIQRHELIEDRKSIGASVETFTTNLALQEQKLITYQRFLEAVLLHHSVLMVGIIEGFGSALKPEEDRKLRSLISEAEAVLDLFHPDRVRVVNALWHLEQIGGDNAVPSLVQLRDDPVADGDIRVKAQEVLGIIQRRLKERERSQDELPPNEKPRAISAAFPPVSESDVV